MKVKDPGLEGLRNCGGFFDSPMEFSDVGGLLYRSFDESGPEACILTPGQGLGACSMMNERLIGSRGMEAAG